MTAVDTQRRGAVAVVTIARPDRRNAVDRATARALADAFRAIDDDDTVAATVLTGAGGHFCSGADLKAVADGDPNDVQVDGDGPMGPTRLTTKKPVIAAIEGYCVAGGLELALWCDLRVASADAVFGVFCRRWGVPLIDGGTVRLPRLIGLSRALDLILTGRSVDATEAVSIGLVHRLTPRGAALTEAVALASQLAAFPQACLRADRASAYAAFDGEIDTALRAELVAGAEALAAEGVAGARDFASGSGRHGAPAAPALPVPRPDKEP